MKPEKIEKLISVLAKKGSDFYLSGWLLVGKLENREIWNGKG